MKAFGGYMNGTNNFNQQASSENQQTTFPQYSQYGQPPPQGYQSPPPYYYQSQPYRKKPATARTIISIIMIVVGGIMCFVNAMMLVVAFIMPRSIGAYYISDMIKNGFFLFSPVFLLIIGVILIVIGIVLFLRKAGRV